MSLSAISGISHLLDISCLDEFFDTYWETRPRLARKAIRGAEADLLTLDDFEELIVAALSNSAAGLSIVEDHKAHPVSGTDTQPTSLYVAVQRGCTLLQSGLQLRWRPIARLCREIENQLISHGLPLAEGIGANAYLTPGNAQAFDIHYDNHCAIILQLHGSKRWSIFPPLEDMPIARCERPIALEDLQPSIIETHLAAGDVLYVPRGFPHFACTAEETSLHLTLSLRPVIWAEAVHALCQTDPAFRRSLLRAHCGRSQAQRHFINELLPRFVDMNVDRFIQARVSEGLARLAPLPQGRLAAADRALDLSSTTLVVRTPFVICLATEEDGNAVLRFPGATLRLPGIMRPVFEFIAGHQEFTPAMLPSISATYDRVELVQVLLERGLLQPADPEACLAEPELLAASAEGA